MGNRYSEASTAAKATSSGKLSWRSTERCRKKVLWREDKKEFARFAADYKVATRHTQTGRPNETKCTVSVSPDGAESNYFENNLCNLHSESPIASFLPRDAMYRAVYAVARCPSVCSSHAGIPSKRLNMISPNFCKMAEIRRFENRYVEFQYGGRLGEFHGM